MNCSQFNCPMQLPIDAGSLNEGYIECVLPAIALRVFVVASPFFLFCDVLRVRFYHTSAGTFPAPPTGD